ncbi:prepilin-type N-terminal cleavage/methylation domain-containing protein [Clostridium sp.]|jgi:prepilin-type N-terminal cleavage/methylation domain-containing protein|uniref:type IV pilus modification PilV family protein n=1 Tax=Clostridium sp. TaxID=1506 RepID=UPI003EF0731B
MKYKKKKGLTLIEVIISLAILGIIITPILSMTLTSVKISESSEEKILATNLAQQCTEYIKSADTSMPNFQTIMKTQLGLIKLVDANTSDNENLAKINVILNGDPEILDYYLYNGENKQKYKNFLTKIAYHIDEETIINEDSDNSNYDMIITVDTDNKISIMDNKSNLIASSVDMAFSEGNPRPVIKIINNESNVECSVKQGNLNLGVEIGKDPNATGKVKIIFKSTNNVNVDINAENMESVDSEDIKPTYGNLDLKVLKTSDSNYDYTVVENHGTNSDYINEQYEIFDINKQDPNKLMKKYIVNIEVWYYDSRSNTKFLMQQVKTYKTI